MPELPEVEVVRAGLAKAVTGALVGAVEVFDARSLKRHLAGADDFVNRLSGKQILAAIRRGKFLWFPLADKAGMTGEALVGHLGMSGQLLLREQGADLDRNTRVRMFLAHPEHGDLAVNFVDQRIFGSLAIDDLVGLDAQAGFAGEATGEWANYIPGQVAHISRDGLDPLFDDALFIEKVQRKQVGIKRILLDQTLISGVGNIYADEALWAAKIHYASLGKDLSAEQLRELLVQVRAVLRKALAEGGTSFDYQYVNVNGEAGYFAHSLNAYAQTGKPCARCGTLIVREAFMNRSSHFCPVCQPAL